MTDADKPRTINVRIVMNVTISPDEWNETYGRLQSDKEIREDVRGDARQAVDYDLNARGLTAEVN